MGVRFSFLEDGRGVEIVAEGLVEGADIIAVNRQVYAEPYLGRQRYQIIDKSRCTEYAVSAEEIEQIAELDLQASRINPGIVFAIIESRQLRFSLTELWQAHLRNSPFATKSFSDRQSALRWISEKRSRE